MEDLDSEMDSYWLSGSKGDDKASAKGQEVLDGQMESYWSEKPADDAAATTEAAEPPAAPAE